MLESYQAPSGKYGNVSFQNFNFTCMLKIPSLATNSTVVFLEGTLTLLILRKCLPNTQV